MYIFPQIPPNLLFSDYLKGERSQVWGSNDGYHQYLKWLDRVRYARLMSDTFKESYKRMRQNNYNPLKMKRTCHNMMMRDYGFSLEWSEHYFEDNA